MIQLLAVIFGIIMVSIPVMAQVYPNKTQEIKEPFDQVVEQTNAFYSNETTAGAAEETKSQEIRYEEMTNAIDEANERHFEMSLNSIQ